MKLLYDIAILFLGICPQNWKQGLKQMAVHPCSGQRYSQQPEVGNKMWAVHTTDYYSTLIKKAVLTHATTQVDLEDIMQWESSQSTKTQILYDST